MIKKFLKLVLGILGSTGSTFVLFVVFSKISESQNLGLYGLLTAACTMIVRFTDGTSGQRIFQKTALLIRHSTLNSSNSHRIIFYSLLGSVLEIFGYLVFKDKFFGFGLLIFAQGIYASCVGIRILIPGQRFLLSLQLLNTLSFATFSVVLLARAVVIDASSMMIFHSLALIVPCLPFAIYDLVIGFKTNKRVLRFLYLGRRNLEQMRWIFSYQAVNSLSGSVDSFVAGTGGAALVAEYQVVQRPLLALGTLNVSIGQFSMNEITHKGYNRWKKLFLISTPAILIWPLLGFVSVLVLPFIFDEELVPSPTIGVLLGLAYGVGALMQVSGIALTFSSQNRALLLIACIQLSVFFAFGLLLVSSYSLVGLIWSMIISRCVGLVMQLWLVSKR